MKCPECKNKNDGAQAFCGKCGAKLENNKSKTILIIVCMVCFTIIVSLTLILVALNKGSTQKATSNTTAAEDVFTAETLQTVAATNDDADNTTLSDSKGLIYTSTPAETTEGSKNEANSLINKFGLSSQEEFVSCTNGGEIPYPDSIYGIISIKEVDLNNDGVKEVLVARVEKSGDGRSKIVAEIYKSTNDSSPVAYADIYDISYSSGANIYLFYSDILSKYCIIAESASSGSVTGVSSQSAKIYTISNNSFELYKNLENVPTVGITADFASEFQQLNVPFAKYCTEYDNKANNSQYTLLCEIEHQITGDSGTYMTRDHKLKIVEK